MTYLKCSNNFAADCILETMTQQRYSALIVKMSIRKMTWPVLLTSEKSNSKNFAAKTILQYGTPTANLKTQTFRRSILCQSGFQRT